MNCLFLTFNFPDSKTGLFYSTHERIKHYDSILNSYFILNVQFYDSFFLYYIKKALKLNPKKKGLKLFEFDGITYNNIWLKRGVFSSVTPWFYLERFRLFKFLCNHDYLSDGILESVCLDFKSKFSFDFIMAHWGYPNGFISFIMSKFLNIPYFVTFHGSDINVTPHKNPIMKRFIIDVLKNSKLNLFVSHALYLSALKICPELIGDISYNGINKEFIRLNYVKNTKDYYHIVFVGNLNYDKRADQLPKIIRSIVNKSNFNCFFTIIGKGEYEFLIKDEIKEIKANINLAGYLDNIKVHNILKESDILILPSRNEGLPLVILEAISNGVIPIVSNVGGLSEFLDNDFIVDITDNFIEDFSDRVIHLINSKKFPNLDIFEFTWDKIVEKEFNIIMNKIYG